MTLPSTTNPKVLPASFMQSLQRTSDLRNDWATVLIYAPARWGKTRLGMSADHPLVLATEMGKTKGLQTLAHLDVDAIEVTGAKHFDTLCDQLREADCTKPDGYRYNTVITDSGSHLGELWLEAGAEAMGWRDVWLTREGKDPRNAYSYLAEKGRQTMKKLFAVPAHIVFLCREGIQEEGDGKNKISFAAPELPGQKLPRELPGWPDATLHGVIINGLRVLRTRTVNKAVAGIRVRGDIEVPEYIKPNLDLICKLVVAKGADNIRPILDQLKVEIKK